MKRRPYFLSSSAWRRALDPLIQHYLLGGVVGFALICVLIPALLLLGGATGTLGPSVPLFFLIPVLLASAIGGWRTGVVVAAAAVLSWDWFFISPLHTVTIASARDVFALAVFLAVALLVGRLSAVARRRTAEAVNRARSAEALYALSMDLIGRRPLADVLTSVAGRLRDTFDLEACAVLLRHPQAPVWRTIAEAGHLTKELRVESSRNIEALVAWTDREGRESGLDPEQAPSQGRPAPEANADARRAQFLPLRVGGRSIGVLELVHDRVEAADGERHRLLTTFANGMTLALEQDRLAEEERAAVLARESDSLKSALLSSVSHDLRTPLAGIKAAASSLLQPDVEWSEDDRRAFVVDIDAEADRLTRLVSNLLDLSRIEAGAIQPHKEWEDVPEFIERIVRRLRGAMSGHRIDLEVARGIPPAQFDAVHVEQAVVNLVENAVKYSPVGSPITVTVSVVPSSQYRMELRVAVTDAGPGIAREEQPRIFEKFYRVSSSGGRAGGTGMGLAIVKGLVEANGGHVLVESAPGNGSTFTIALPLSPDLARAVDAEERSCPVPEIPSK